MLIVVPVGFPQLIKTLKNVLKPPTTMKINKLSLEILLFKALQIRLNLRSLPLKNHLVP
jgi:hypothetical protein